MLTPRGGTNAVTGHPASLPWRRADKADDDAPAWKSINYFLGVTLRKGALSDEGVTV
jgi:hypothetical protein